MWLLLKRLAARDLIVLEDDEIIGAYPLTDRPSEHRVVIADRELHAMCAIDALGVGAMYRADTTINSRCRLCHAPIYIVTGDAGRYLATLSPAEAVVFTAVGYLTTVEGLKLAALSFSKDVTKLSCCAG